MGIRERGGSAPWRLLGRLLGGSRRSARALAARPWERHRLADFDPPPTMLSREEISLLHWLGSRYFTGTGEVVDAGCFLGGSTAALADGVTRNVAVRGSRRRIHSYDTFILDWYAKRTFFADSPLEIGDSFHDRWRDNVRRFEDLVVPHRGDICAHPWNGEPVEILFLDVMKTVEVQTAVTERWFPCLLGERSVVIQQDYVHEWQPWIIVSMELLHEYFVPLDYFDYGSAVYLCNRVPPREAVVAADVAAQPLPLQLEAMERAAGRVPPRYVPVIQLARARLLMNFGCWARARETIAATLQSWPGDPRAAQVGQQMLELCRQAEVGSSAGAMRSC